MNYDDLGKSYAPKSVFANHYESFEIPWKKKEEFTFAQPPINISVNFYFILHHLN